MRQPTKARALRPTTARTTTVANTGATAAKAATLPEAPAPAQGIRDESVAAVHPAACRHVLVHGRDHARRARRLSLPTALGAAGGRLPDDPGANDLSGREPGGHEPDRHRAARASARTDAGIDPDVVDERRRRLDRDAAVRPRAHARRRGAGSPGGDQRERLAAADGSAGAARVREGEPRRRAGAHAS